MDKDAYLSADGRYRYWLTRTWDEASGRMIVIGLNPSTADAEIDDRTIGRVCAFAMREGCGGIMMLNLFALRATDPSALRTLGIDPVGPENDEVLSRMLMMPSARHGVIVAAWGAHGGFRSRDKTVIAMADSLDVELMCFGQNADCTPKHPLYLPGDTPLVAML